MEFVARPIKLTRFFEFPPKRKLIFLVYAVLVVASSYECDASEPVNLTYAKNAASFRIKTVLEAEGHLQIHNKAKKDPTELPMRAVATIVYDEVHQDDKSVRYYHTAKAEIDVAKRPRKIELRSNRRHVVCQQENDSVELSCATGAITRDELELITVPCNSMLVNDLLPDKPVSVGDTWTHDDTLLAELTNLDAVTGNDVVSKITAIQKNVVRIEINGKLIGSVDGVLSDIELKGKYNFDLKTKRINWLAWNIKEQRAISALRARIQSQRARSHACR